MRLRVLNTTPPKVAAITLKENELDAQDLNNLVSLADRIAEANETPMVISFNAAVQLRKAVALAEKAMQPTPTTAEKGAVSANGLTRYDFELDDTLDFVVMVPSPLGDYFKVEDVEALLAAQPVAQSDSDAAEDAYVIDRMGKLLAGVAVALKGPEKALHRHGYQDLPELAEKLMLELELHRAKEVPPAAPVASKEAVSEPPTLGQLMREFADRQEQAKDTPTIAAEGVPSVDTPRFRELLNLAFSKRFEGVSNGVKAVDNLIAHLNADKAAAVADVQRDMGLTKLVLGQTLERLRKADAAHEAAEAKVRELEVKLTGMVRWLEDNQSDVFKRGMWEVIGAAHEAAKPSEGSGDAIARSKRILALVDDYVERQTQHTRTALRVALHDEFTAALAQPAEPVGGEIRELLSKCVGPLNIAFAVASVHSNADASAQTRQQCQEALDKINTILAGQPAPATDSAERSAK